MKKSKIFYNNNIKKIQIIKMLNINYTTFNIWFIKYNKYFINNIQLTKEDFEDIKKQHVWLKNRRFFNQ